MAHIVMPARRSDVPGHWVRRCSNPNCPWVAHHVDPEALAVLAREHHEGADTQSEATR